MQYTEQQLDRNVKRTVMVQGLRKIHQLLDSWEREERSARRIALVVCGVLLLLVVAGAVYMWSGATLVTIK